MTYILKKLPDLTRDRIDLFKYSKRFYHFDHSKYLRSAAIISQAINQYNLIVEGCQLIDRSIQTIETTYSVRDQNLNNEVLEKIKKHQKDKASLIANASELLSIIQNQLSELIPIVSSRSNVEYFLNELKVLHDTIKPCRVLVAEEQLGILEICANQPQMIANKEQFTQFHQDIEAFGCRDTKIKYRRLPWLLQLKNENDKLTRIEIKQKPFYVLSELENSYRLKFGIFSRLFFKNKDRMKLIKKQFHQIVTVKAQQQSIHTRIITGISQEQLLTNDLLRHPCLEAINQCLAVIDRQTNYNHRQRLTGFKQLLWQDKNASIDVMQQHLSQHREHVMAQKIYFLDRTLQFFENNSSPQELYFQPAPKLRELAMLLETTAQEMANRPFLDIELNNRLAHLKQRFEALVNIPDHFIKRIVSEPSIFTQQVEISPEGVNYLSLDREQVTALFDMIKPYLTELEQGSVQAIERLLFCDEVKTIRDLKQKLLPLFRNLENSQERLENFIQYILSNIILPSLHHPGSNRFSLIQDYDPHLANQWLVKHQILLEDAILYLNAVFGVSSHYLNFLWFQKMFGDQKFSEAQSSNLPNTLCFEELIKRVGGDNIEVLYQLLSQTLSLDFLAPEALSLIDTLLRADWPGYDMRPLKVRYDVLRNQLVVRSQIQIESNLLVDLCHKGQWLIALEKLKEHLVFCKVPLDYMYHYQVILDFFERMGSADSPFHKVEESSSEVEAVLCRKNMWEFYQQLSKAVNDTLTHNQSPPMTDLANKLKNIRNIYAVYLLPTAYFLSCLHKGLFSNEEVTSYLINLQNEIKNFLDESELKSINDLCDMILGKATFHSLEEWKIASKPVFDRLPEAFDLEQTLRFIIEDFIAPRITSIHSPDFPLFANSYPDKGLALLEIECRNVEYCLAVLKKALCEKAMDQEVWINGKKEMLSLSRCKDAVQTILQFNKAAETISAYDVERKPPYQKELRSLFVTYLRLSRVSFKEPISIELIALLGEDKLTNNFVKIWVRQFFSKVKYDNNYALFASNTTFQAYYHLPAVQTKLHQFITENWRILLKKGTLFNVIKYLAKEEQQLFISHLLANKVVWNSELYEGLLQNGNEENIRCARFLWLKALFQRGLPTQMIQYFRPQEIADLSIFFGKHVPEVIGLFNQFISKDIEKKNEKYYTFIEMCLSNVTPNNEVLYLIKQQTSRYLKRIQELNEVERNVYHVIEQIEQHKYLKAHSIIEQWVLNLSLYPDGETHHQQNKVSLDDLSDRLSSLLNHHIKNKCYGEALCILNLKATFPHFDESKELCLRMLPKVFIDHGSEVIKTYLKIRKFDNQIWKTLKANISLLTDENLRSLKKMYESAILREFDKTIDKNHLDILTSATHKLYVENKEYIDSLLNAGLEVHSQFDALSKKQNRPYLIQSALKQIEKLLENKKEVLYRKISVYNMGFFALSFNQKAIIPKDSPKPTPIKVVN